MSNPIKQEYSLLQNQYNAVVEQNKSLQQELNAYKSILSEIKKMLDISMATPNGDVHFEYVYNAQKLLNDFVK